jgi:dihydrofolate reductase
MVNYSVIVAVNENLVIGKDNKLPWHSSEDLKYFKRITSDNVVIMGRKTYESIGKALPNRVNIVISNTTTFDDVITVNSFHEALNEASKYTKEIFVIGGASLYEQVLNDAEKLYLTWVYEKKVLPSDGDAYLESFNKSEWLVVKEDLVLGKDANLVFQVSIKNTPIQLAKYKAYGVVNSCETVDQIDSAYNYIDQYLTMYEDEYNYLELKKILLDKQSKFV